MIYKFEINERLPSFNDYTKACRSNKYIGAKMKQQIEDKICYYIISQLKNIKIQNPVFIRFTWIEENKKRDLDNICFAKKFILDALQKKNIIENDNQKHIKGFVDEFKTDEKSKVIVELEEI